MAMSAAIQQLPVIISFLTLISIDRHSLASKRKCDFVTVGRSVGRSADDGGGSVDDGQWQ